MRVHRSIAFLAALATASAAVAAKKPQPDFELIRYRLPATGVAARLSLTLESCEAGGITVSGEGSLVAEAGAAPGTFSLTSRQLESARVKRSVGMTLHDTGTIATVESAAEDRTGSILGNVIKFVAGVAGAFLGRPLAAGAAGGGTKAKTTCSEGVTKALARIAAIETALAEWRTSDVPADPKDAADQSKAIDRLAAERAALRVGILHVDLSSELDLAKLAAGGADTWTATTAFDTEPLGRAWLKAGATAPAIRAAWTVRLPLGTGVPAAAQQPAALCRASLDAMGGQGICFATPAQAAFQAKVGATGMTILNGAVEPKGSFPMPQWGTLRVLGLSAGFGSNREASLTLYKFGRVSAAKWTSAARAENATAALAGIAGQASAIAAANGETAREKSEIEALTTQQTLNRLRACREILDAGGSACPAEATIEEEQ